ncbi:MAG: hypothetical protein ACRD29_09620 [Acidimicrobiales bacterium]
MTPSRKTDDATRPADEPVGLGELERPAPIVESGGRSSRIGLIVVLALLVIGVGVVAALQWRDARDLATDRDRRDDVADIAGRFADTLFTYDFNDLGASRERVISMATDEFTELYDQAFIVGLEPAITQLQAVSEAEVRDVYTTEVSSRAARAIVVVDAEVTTTAGTRRLLGSYLEMELVRVHERWLINTVAQLAADNETLTPVPGAEGVTTTTAPPAGG